MKKLDIIPVILFLSLLHFFLYPLINVSSGEFKPRGIFVDEHGFVITALNEASETSKLPFKDYFSKYNNDDHNKLKKLNNLEEIKALLHDFIQSCF